VFENRAARIYGPKRGEIIKMHKEELHSLYSSPNIITMMK
jgi:hypothetical protein